jgi:hypothetical protein
MSEFNGKGVAKVHAVNVAAMAEIRLLSLQVNGPDAQGGTPWSVHTRVVYLFYWL